MSGLIGMSCSKVTGFSTSCESVTEQIENLKDKTINQVMNCFSFCNKRTTLEIVDKTIR